MRQAEENGEDPNTAAIRTLYIDRDPVTFKDISLHLQGYHVAPRDAGHFVKLFADAQFYSCLSSFPLLKSSILTLDSATINFSDV